MRRTLIGELLATFILGFVYFHTTLAERRMAPTGIGVEDNVAFGLAVITITIVFKAFSTGLYNPLLPFVLVCFRMMPPWLGLAIVCMQLIGAVFSILMCVLTWPGTYMNIVRELCPLQTITHTKAVMPYVLTGETVATGILFYILFSVRINENRDPSFSLYGDHPNLNYQVAGPVASGFAFMFVSLVIVNGVVTPLNPSFIVIPQLMVGRFDKMLFVVLAQMVGALLGAGIQSFILYK